MTHKKTKIFFEYLFIAAGCTVMAAALNIFLDPNGIVIGGATGVAIIISRLSQQLAGIPIPLWLTNAVINIPLFAIAFKAVGFKTTKRSLFGAAFLSVALYFTENLPQVKNDLFLAAVFGGLLSGIGVGLVLRQNAATGGSDLAAFLINKLIPHFSTSQIMFIIDTIIIFAGLYVFGFNKALYALISAFITAKVADMVVGGLDFAKAVFIISDNNINIAHEITTLLDRGATFISGSGVYSGKHKDIIMCVVTAKQINRLISIVKEADKNSFVIITDIKEAFGQGFKRI